MQMHLSDGTVGFRLEVVRGALEGQRADLNHFEESQDVSTIIATVHASTGSVALDKHSFLANVPLTFDTGLNSWYLTGASIARNEGIILVPAVQDKFGFAFLNQPIPSSNFEVIADIDTQYLGLGNPNQAFAMWYTATNSSAEMDDVIKKKVAASPKGVVADWAAIALQEGRTLHAMKPTFRGIGVFFEINSGGKTSEISFAVNDGSKSVTFDPKLTKYFDFSSQKDSLQVKFRFNRDKVDIRVKMRSTSYWTDIGSTPVPLNLITPTGGYLGLTASSGKGGKGADRITLRQLQSFSFETPSKLSAGSEMMIAAEGSDNILTLKKATEVLLSHLSENKPASDKMVTQVIALQQRIGKIESSLDQLRLEVKYTFKAGASGSLGKRELQGIMSELHGLTQSLSEDDNRISDLANKFHSGRDSLGMSDALHRTSSQLEDAIRNTYMTASAVVIAFILLTCLMGVALYRRMTSYEKKHFL